MQKDKLTDDRFLKDGFYQPKSKDEEKEIRSMNSDLTFEKLYRHCAEVEKQNAELQKQVDELKKENYQIARKIFGEMMGIWFALRQYCPVSEDIKFISNSNTLRDCISEAAKKYGVEVE